MAYRHESISTDTFAIAAILLWAAAGSASAQSIGYAQALDQLGATCGKDIDKFCKKVNLGGGRMTQCLGQNQAVSATCRASITAHADADRDQGAGPRRGAAGLRRGHPAVLSRRSAGRRQSHGVLLTRPSRA